MNEGTLVARGGAADGTMVGGGTGTCVLLEGGGEGEFERFNGCKVHCEVCSKGGCETGIGVPFIGIGMAEFETLSCGIVDGTRFVACGFPFAVASVGCRIGICVLFEVDGETRPDTFNGCMVP